MSTGGPDRRSGGGRGGGLGTEEAAAIGDGAGDRGDSGAGDSAGDLGDSGAGDLGDHDAGRGAATRERILAVALDRFAAHGYAGTSIRDLADGLGVTKAALYYHFASKEDILEALVEPMASEWGALVQRASTRPAPPAEGLLRELVDILSRRAALIRTVMADPSLPSPQVREQLQVLANALAAGAGVGASGAAGVRARAALGAAQHAALSTALSRVAAGRPGPAPGAAPTGTAGTHLLEPDEREEIVAAALRALCG